MRVLIVTPLLPPETGGPSYYAVGLAGALTRAGCTVSTIAFHEVRGYPSGIRHLLFLYKVLVRAWSVDTLIILDTVSVALPAVLAGWVLGKQTIVRVGGDFVWERYVERTHERVKLSEFYGKIAAGACPPLSRTERSLMWLQAYVVVRLATIVAFSTAWQRDLWTGPYRIPAAKCMVVENAYAVPAQKLARPDDRARTFVSAGRDLVLKNADTLASAFTAVKAQYPGMELMQLTNAFREEVMRALADARCLVVPSVSEVSPNIVFEALARGVPVICTSDTGIRERAADVVCFVDTATTSSLETVLLQLCDNAAYRECTERVKQYLLVRTYDDVARELCALL